MVTKISSSTVAAISVTTAIVGFILGIVIATIVLLRYQTLYTKLQTLCKRSIPATALTYDKGRPESTSRAFSAYTEIDERNTQSLAGHTGQGIDKNLTKHSTYEEYSNDKQKYTNLKQSGLKDTRNNYDQINVNEGSVKPSTGLSVSCPVYHIFEPGTNNRLPVSPLATDMLQTDNSHVYFKLEPGSDRVVSVSVGEVKDEIQTVNKRKSEAHTYFVLQPQRVPLKPPKKKNPHVTRGDEEEPKYYILEKTT